MFIYSKSKHLLTYNQNKTNVSKVMIKYWIDEEAVAEAETVLILSICIVYQIEIVKGRS